MNATDPYVILFNGPPRVGKDTIAALLIKRLRAATKMPVIEANFKQPMMDAALAIFGIDPLDYDARKDEQNAAWGCSLREWMIDFSESYMKPKFGKDVWGAAAKARISDWGAEPMIVVFTDLGFPEEYRHLVEHSHRRRVCTVQMGRDGIGWANDSRRYVNPMAGAHAAWLRNDGAPEDAADKLFGTLEQCFGADWLG